MLTKEKKKKSNKKTQPFLSANTYGYKQCTMITQKYVQGQRGQGFASDGMLLHQSVQTANLGRGQSSTCNYSNILHIHYTVTVSLTQTPNCSAMFNYKVLYKHNISALMHWWTSMFILPTKLSVFIIQFTSLLIFWVWYLDTDWQNTPKAQRHVNTIDKDSEFMKTFNTQYDFLGCSIKKQSQCRFWRISLNRPAYFYHLDWLWLKT